MRLFLVIVAASLSVTACGDSPANPSGVSTLNVRLTDSPFSDARAVLVTFSEIAVHRADEAWTTVPFADNAVTRTCDLKKLQGPQDVLGIGALMPGHYTQIRLMVASAALYFDNVSAGPACAATIAAPPGRSARLEIPSGEVKLNRQFELTANDATTMVLDFDGDQSIKETGNGRFMMVPVIAIVSVQ